VIIEVFEVHDQVMARVGDAARLAGMPRLATRCADSDVALYARPVSRTDRYPSEQCELGCVPGQHRRARVKIGSDGSPSAGLY